jgi:hypothetical protein
MTFLKKLRNTAGLASMLAIAGVSSINAAAQDNTITTLEITAGALVMYAADDVNNNDLCASGETGTFDFLQDNASTTSVTCSNIERTVTFSPISVTSLRQNTTTTLNDMLFEDLSGSVSTNYSVSMTVGNFTRTGGGSIDLGSNPDNATADADADAPTGINAGRIFAAVDPSAAGSQIYGITPGSATAAVAAFTSGARTTTIDTNISVNVLSSNGTAAAGRYDIDGVVVKFRIPAFVTAGSYTGSITQTVVAS